MEDFFIVLVIFATFFGILYMYFSTRHKERIALIDKGADASMFKTGKKIYWGNFAPSAGMFLIGAGPGVLVAAILTATTVIMEGVAYPSMIFIFAGAGLVLYFFLARKLKNGE